MYPLQVIAFRCHVHSVAAIDNYSPIHPLMRLLQAWSHGRFDVGIQGALMIYERLGPFKWLRKLSTDFALEYIRAEAQGHKQ